MADTSKEPTAFVDAVAAVTRNLTDGIPIEQLNGGCNEAASCSPGIGINVGGGKLEERNDEWTLLDQDAATRVPQIGQYIGSTGLGDGAEGKGTVGINVYERTDYDVPTAPTVDGQAQLSALATGWESDGTP